ncbi:hypothetical protein JNB11_02635 [Kocuria palustris]|nr:hypothetical protein [Kocuria palustris]
MPELPLDLQICKKCNQPIFEGHAYELGDDRWHILCFKCLKCELLLGCNLNFLVLGNGNLICSNCLYNCKQCNKKIDDLAILTGDQAYCLNCFKCRLCKMKIEDLRYARTLKGLFCMECHEKLMAKKKKYDARKRHHELAKDGDKRSLVALKNSRNSLLNLYMLSLAAAPAPHLADAMFANLNPSQLLLLSLKDKLLPAPPVRNQTPPLNEYRDSFPLARTENLVATSQFTVLTLAVLPAGALPAVRSVTTDYLIEEVRDLEDDEAFLQRAPLLRQRLNPQLAAALKNQSLGSPGAPPARSSLRLPLQPAQMSQTSLLAPEAVTEYNSKDNYLPRQNAGKLGPAVELAPQPRREANKNDGSDKPTDRSPLPDISPLKFGKNLLILLPNQFHDHEFHTAQQYGQPESAPGLPPLRGRRGSLLLAVDDSQKRPPTLPFARANRQARVVESNDFVLTDSLTERDSELDLPPSSRRRPSLPLPRHPLSRQGSDLKETPQGLGLVGVSIDPNELALKRRAPPPMPEDDAGLELLLQQGLSRKTLLRTPKLPSLRHKRLISGSGLSLANKFGFFKPREGRQPLVSEGTELSQTTPQLSQFQLPLFTATHLRLTLDLYDIYQAAADDPLRQEVAQLAAHKKQLEYEVRTLTTEKHALLAETRQMQERYATDQKQLQGEIAELERRKRVLLETNQHLQEHNASLDGAKAMANSSLSTTVNLSYYNELEEPLAGEPQRAARLKFWKRGKQAGGANLVTTGVPLGNLLAVPEGKAYGGGLNIPGLTSQLLLNVNHHQNGGSLAPPADVNGQNTKQKYPRLRSLNILELFLGTEDGNQCPLYSLTIQQRADFERTRAPLIITKCLAEVERRGLDMEGIYRILGGNLAIVAIENAFANHTGDDKSGKLDETLDCDINAVTSALKRYLRKLPDPLIPFSLYDEFIKVLLNNAATKVDKRVEYLKVKVLDKLPPANLHVLYLLTKHLALVNLYQLVNRMGYKNLLVVFAPTIARDQLGEKEMIDMGYRNNVTEFLMTYADQIFADYNTEYSF